MNNWPELRADQLLSKGFKVKQISCGETHCLLLSDDGRVHGLGKSKYGQSIIPEDIQGRIKQVSSGYTHSLLLTYDGHVISVGSNLYGQFVTKNVRRSINKRIKKVAAGGVFSALLSNDNHLYIIGGIG